MNPFKWLRNKVEERRARADRRAFYNFVCHCRRVDSRVNALTMLELYDLPMDTLITLYESATDESFRISCGITKMYRADYITTVWGGR